MKVVLSAPAVVQVLVRVLALVTALAPLSCTTPVSGPTLSPTVLPDDYSIRYVALGDSYTIGTSVPVNERWPDQLVVRVGATVALEPVDNLAANGASSSDVILSQLPGLAELQPDFVTLLIGVNDVVRGVPESTYQANVGQILAALVEIVPADRIVVVSTPDYTRTPRGADYGDRAQQRAQITRFNDIMGSAAVLRGIAFVDISTVADLAEGDPSLVAADQLHPSGSQYARWVDLIAPVVEDLLRQ